ncbi:jg7085 [Pararge aegeria aegeria]|uniref:Jg7085 protein n=1 Tax=Pararge aegeria aegeria TaxID=348720 RepID=A0A8S4R428_9NEOP|nr:jg7085 [Pararge aegeria aegeria]
MSEKACLDKMTNISPETRIMMMRGEDGRQGYRRQILAALAVSLGPFAAGLSKGYMSPAIASMQESKHDWSFTVSDQQASWIASLSLLERKACAQRRALHTCTKALPTLFWRGGKALWLPPTLGQDRGYAGLLPLKNYRGISLSLALLDALGTSAAYHAYIFI